MSLHEREPLDFGGAAARNCLFGRASVLANLRNGSVKEIDSGEMTGVFQQRFPFAKQIGTHFLVVTSRWDDRTAPGEDFGACHQMGRSGYQQYAWQDPGDPGPPFGA